MVGSTRVDHDHFDVQRQRFPRDERIETLDCGTERTDWLRLGRVGANLRGDSRHVDLELLLLGHGKNHALAKVIEELKKGSSKWLKTQGEAFRGFHWQAGYGARKRTNRRESRPEVARKRRPRRLVSRNRDAPRPTKEPCSGRENAVPRSPSPLAPKAADGPPLA